MHIIIGAIVVAVLIGGFILGARLRNEEGAPPSPTAHPRRPATDRPPGETSEYRRHAEVPRTDQAHRLRPYQLGAATVPLPEPPEG